MTTDSKAALAAALERHHDSEGFCVYCSSKRVFEPWPCDAARAREEIARLREALEEAISLASRLNYTVSQEFGESPEVDATLERLALQEVLG